MKKLFTLFTLLFLIASLQALADCTLESSVTKKCSPTAGGKITSSNCVYTAVPNSGYKFVKWGQKLNNGKESFSTTNPIDPEDALLSISMGYAENLTLTAYFETVVTYTITVKSNNTLYGTVSGGGTYETGTSITIKATPKTGYKFTKWNDGNTNSSRSITVTENATYTATFEAIKYTITWKNADGTTLKTDNVAYGSTPSYSGSTPTKASTTQYTYTFKGWTPTIVAATANATYTATFTQTLRQYTITWKNDDGTTLKSEKVNYGVTPSYSGTTPTKATTAEYTYTFKAWSPTIVSVSGDKTYTATYTATKRKYTVTFQDYDGTTLSSQQIEYGSAANTPNSPTRSGYTFVGWIGSYSNITSSTTIYASYSKNPSISNWPVGALTGLFSVSDSIQISFSQGGLQYNAMAGTHNCADGTTQQGVWRFAENQWNAIYNTENTQASATYNGWISHYGYGTSGWNSGSVAYQPYAQNTNDAEYINTDITGANAYADWGVYNAIFNGGNQPNQWRTLTKNEWLYLLSGRENAAEKMGIACLQDSICGLVFLPDSWTQPTGIPFTPGHNPTEGSDIKETFKAMNSYSFAQWQLMENAGAVFITMESSRESPLNPSYGILHSSTNCVTNTSYVLAHYNGIVTSVNGDSKYKSQAYAVRLVTKATTKRKYTIAFNNYDGTQLQSNNVEYGAMPEYNGEAPTKDSTEVYAYSFAGWIPNIVAVTGDTTYIAKFDSTKIVYPVNITPTDPNIEVNGTVDVTGTPNYGDTITLTPQPEDGYYFDGWNDGNTNNPREIEVTGDINVYPIFKKCESIETVLDTVINNGASFVLNNKSYSKRGTYQDTLTAVNGCDSVVILNLNIRYAVDVTSTDPNIEIHGSVDVDGTPNYGDTITLTPQPEDGWYFDGWSDGNTDNPREIEVTGDVNVYPIFKQCEEIVVNITEVIVKGSSYDFNGTLLSQRGTYSDTLVLANGCDSIVVLKLNVRKPAKYNLRVEISEESGEEMGSVTGAGTYTEGQQVTVTATPASNRYIFVRWYNADPDENGQIINVYDNPYTFTLNDHLTLRAVFHRARK